MFIVERVYLVNRTKKKRLIQKRFLESEQRKRALK